MLEHIGHPLIDVPIIVDNILIFIFTHAETVSALLCVKWTIFLLTDHNNFIEMNTVFCIVLPYAVI